MTIHETPDRQERRRNDERTVILEERVTGLNTSVNRVETKIDGIVDALAGIVRIEERQLANAARISDVQTQVEKQSQRIGAIEVQIPGLNEKARWVVMALLGIAAAVGTSAMAFLVRH